MTFWSCDANGIISSTFAFLRSGQPKSGVNELFGNVTPIALALALCVANGIVNGTTAFHRSR